MIQSLRLQNFRSYEDSVFEFDGGVNIVVGPNASGKTNLLEAVLVSATGTSYRTNDQNLIYFDKPWAKLEAISDNTSTRIVKLEKNGDSFEKSFEIDGARRIRLTRTHQLPVVVFEPEHILLLTGQPERRRAFLDTILINTVAEYQPLLKNYRRTLQQRNALLKKGPNFRDQLFVWDLRLSELAGKLVRYREQLIKSINQAVELHYEQMTGHKAKLELIYQYTAPKTNYTSGLLKKLEQSHELDLLRGFTGCGPHREDFIVLIRDAPADIAASRGETRSIILALKVIELELTEEAFGTQPILLLDDVFSELDGGRRQNLAKALKNYQTFITTTDADVVVEHFMQNYRIIPTQVG